MKQITILLCILFGMLLAREQIYHGTIGTYPITLSFEIDSTLDEITGYYYYNKYKKEIPFTGYFSGNGVTFTVKDVKGTTTETFSADYSPYAMEGSWSHKGKELPLSLTRSPWADSVITVEELRSVPDLVFASGTPNLGSGYGSPNEIDYNCEGSIYSLEYMKPVLKTVEKIRNQTDRMCFGSIMYAQYRHYSFSLLKAMFAPELFDAERQKIRAQYTKHNKDYYGVQRIYFQHWGYSQLTNFKSYKHFITEEDGDTKKHFGDDDSAAVDKLTAYFKKQYPDNAKMATRYADNLFALLLDRAVGGASYFTYKEAPRIGQLEQLLWGKNFLHNLDTYLQDPVETQELNQALRAALLRGLNTDILDKIISVGAELNSGHESPLFFALKNPLNTVAFLIEKGAEVDYQNSFGKTPLFYAVGFNDTALVKLLISKGADVNATYFSKTQLDSVVSSEANPTYIDFCPLKHTKRSVLMHAAQNSKVAMLRILLKAGATLEAVDELGYNAADYAKMDGNAKNFVYLSEKGLKPAKL